MPDALRGVYAPLATLVDPQGRVLAGDMGRQIDAIRGWVSGLMPGIGCGEGIHLDDDQWRAVLLATLSASGDLPVFMGVQAPTWQVARRRTVAAAEEGVDGVVVGIPAEESHAGMGRVLHECTQLARECPVDMVFYWESFISSAELSGEDAARVCAALGAMSVKDSMRNPAASAALRECRPGISLLEGWEDLLLADHPLDGYVGPLALLTAAPATLFTDEPDWERCLREAHEYGVLEEDYVSRVKWELHARGIASHPSLVSRR
jgi:dihydrodipicolinate synthase/N-acetylneuraminate lyase